MTVRSLRWRFFITVWPIAVAATVTVGLWFTRWTDVQFARIVGADGIAPVFPPWLSDTVAGAW
jgi:hypothetical protein